jgi:PTH2 family peptidyl-tRNA hydrolase
MKQVILVNKALKLPRGKLAAQVAHASLSAFLRAPQAAQRKWLGAGMPKVVLHCEVEGDLLSFESKAGALKLPVALIRDAGHTVVDPGTVTCLGIGPADASAIDHLTGSLKLVK